jgi:hypothetical protein
MCPDCHYPLEATYPGQQVRCPYCGTISEAITATTSTTVLVGVLAFLAGVVIGPAFILGAKAGQEALERRVRSKIR